MKAKLVFALLALYICSYSCRIHSVKTQEIHDLYSSKDDVIRLNSTNFVPTVFHRNKNVTFMVQFYNTYCGHCQRFAPIYKELASRVKNWTTVFRIAGIDCSKDENLITCTDNKIDGYPTILIFPPNAHAQDPRDAPLNLRSLNIEPTVDNIEETVIDYLANLTHSDRQYPQIVHAFKPINVSNAVDINRLYTFSSEGDNLVNDNNRSTDFMIIIEPESSFLGRKLMLEYYRLNSKLELRRLLLTNLELLRGILSSQDLVNLEKDQPLLVKLIDANSKVQVLVRGEAEHTLPTGAEHERQDFIFNRFKSFIDQFYSVELKERDSISHTISENWKLPIGDSYVKVEHNDETRYLLRSDPDSRNKVFAIDLIKCISYMINHEVLIRGDLKPFEFQIVRNLLTILKKYLPLSKWDSSVYNFVDQLRTRLDAKRNSYEKDGISAQEMRDILNLSGGEAIRLRYNREYWISCSESDRQDKGYTCSLWLLFHTLTVGEYIKAAPERLNPKLVLSTMRDYITNFLGCTVCSSNFARETEFLDKSLISRNSSVLWLWNTHNLVNQRLNNERETGKRSLLSVLFPSASDCAQCMLGDSSEIDLDGKTLADIKWNSTSVFEHLLNIYGPEMIVSPREVPSLLSRIKEKTIYNDIDGNANNDRVFSTSDISLCLFLYIACIIIVILVCIVLNPQWKLFKTR